MLWMPNGLNGVPNGSSEEKCSTSALVLFSLSPLSRLLQKRPNVPTDVIFILYEWKKFLGTRFRPFVPT